MTEPTAVEATKACPFCAEIILKAAVGCKHCGRDLPSTPVRKKNERRPSPKWLPLAVIGGLLLLVAGFLGYMSLENQRSYEFASQMDFGYDDRQMPGHYWIINPFLDCQGLSRPRCLAMDEARAAERESQQSRDNLKAAAVWSAILLGGGLVTLGVINTLSRRRAT